jgi:hypothetical protein
MGRPATVEVPDNPESQRSLRNAALLTAAVGAIHAALFLVASWLLSQVPGPRASDEEVIAYYTSSSQRVSTLVGLYVMPFAGIAFLWFIVALRMWIAAFGRREDALLSNVQLVSGILYIGLFFASAGANSVIAASTEFENGEIDPVLARLFPQFGSTLLLVFALKMGGTFVIATSKIGLTSEVLPKWFGYAGILVGVTMLLAATFNGVLGLLFPTWMLVLSVLLVLRARKIPSDKPLAQPVSPG